MQYPDDYYDSNTCRVALFLQHSDENTPALEPLTFRQLFEYPLWKVAEFMLVERLLFTVDVPNGKRPCVSALKKQQLQAAYRQHEEALKSLETTMRTCLELDTTAIPAPVREFSEAIRSIGLFFPPNHVKPEDKPKVRDLFSEDKYNFLNVKLQDADTPLVGDITFHDYRTKYTLGGSPATQIQPGAYKVLRKARKAGVLLRFAQLSDLSAN